MLLRVVTKKWEIYAIWFILISINIVMLLCALFQFVQCKNPAYGELHSGIDGRFDLAKQYF